MSRVRRGEGAQTVAPRASSLPPTPSQAWADMLAALEAANSREMFR